MECTQFVKQPAEVMRGWIGGTGSERIDALQPIVGRQPATRYQSKRLYKLSEGRVGTTAYEPIIGGHKW